MMDVSLDIETLGVQPGSVVLSIGAARFDPRGVDKPRFYGAYQHVTWNTAKYIDDDVFYMQVDLQNSLDIGMTLDVGTLRWWMGQDISMFQALTSNGAPALDVVTQFTKWMGAREYQHVWGNSPSFDCVLIECLIRKVLRPYAALPWTHRQQRDIRTLKHCSNHDLVEVLPDAKGLGYKLNKHHGLLDAMVQAHHIWELHLAMAAAQRSDSVQ